MKLRHLFVAMCGLFMIGLAACCDNDATIRYAQLPSPVKQFMGQYFAGEKIQTITADTDDAVPEYDILLANGTKVEIDSVGSWKEIKNDTVAVPVTMLPDSTQTYITTNYASEKVVKVEKDSKGYEVKFANGVEVKFDQAGAFRKIDDLGYISPVGQCKN